MNFQEAATSQRSWFSRQTTGLIQAGRPFIKMHGLRNDFIIVDGRDKPYRPCVAEIVRICDRHEGVGGDQLVVVEPPRSEGSYISMRILNTDGREAEACGNATRCIGWLMLSESNRKEVVIETKGGMLVCNQVGEKLISVEMGKVRTEWQEIPLSREMDTLQCIGKTKFL